MLLRVRRGGREPGVSVPFSNSYETSFPVPADAPMSPCRHTKRQANPLSQLRQLLQRFHARRHAPAHAGGLLVVRLQHRGPLHCTDPDVRHRPTAVPQRDAARLADQQRRNHHRVEDHHRHKHLRPHSGWLSDHPDPGFHHARGAPDRRCRDPGTEVRWPVQGADGRWGWPCFTRSMGWVAPVMAVVSGASDEG